MSSGPGDLIDMREALAANDRRRAEEMRARFGDVDPTCQACTDTGDLLPSERKYAPCTCPPDMKADRVARAAGLGPNWRQPAQPAAPPAPSLAARLPLVAQLELVIAGLPERVEAPGYADMVPLREAADRLKHALDVERARADMLEAALRGVIEREEAR